MFIHGQKYYNIMPFIDLKTNYRVFFITDKRQIMTF